MAIEPMTAGHYPEVARIFPAGIATGNATFETEPAPWEGFDAAKLPEHRWVAVDGEQVLGWVAASAGFRPVGTRERVGLMTHGPYAGRWRDVVLVERRSRVVGGLVDPLGTMAG